MTERAPSLQLLLTILCRILIFSFLEDADIVNLHRHGKGIFIDTLRATPVTAPGEIDIMEEVGYHPDFVSSSLHANAHVHSNNTQVTHEMYCKGAEGEFHTYAIEWTAQNITTYVDGKVQLSYDNKGLGRDDWPYNDPFYVIFNLAWGGDWGGSQGVDENALPVTMEVDYIRVFQKK